MTVAVCLERCWRMGQGLVLYDTRYLLYQIRLRAAHVLKISYWTVNLHQIGRGLCHRLLTRQPSEQPSSAVERLISVPVFAVSNRDIGE